MGKLWLTIVLGLVWAVLPPIGAAADVVCADHDPFSSALETSLLDEYPGQRFSASVYDQRTGCTYDLFPDERITTASVFKIEVMAGVLLKAQNEGRDLTPWEEARIWPMITESADPPTNALFGYLGGQAGFADLHDLFGLDETSLPPLKWGATSTSAADQVHLVRQVLLGEFGPLEEPYRRLAWEFMTSVVDDQSWGISGGVNERWTVALKNGFFSSSEAWRVNSSGFVQDLGGSGYAITILSIGWPNLETGMPVVEMMSEAVWAALAPLSAPDGLPFVDVGPDEWSLDPIRWAYVSTVTYGISPTEFAPLRTVTRGEAAGFIVRALAVPPASDTGFTDTVGSVFAADIDAIAAAKVSLGCNPPANDRYCPDVRITRGAFAAMLTRALELPSTDADAFVDDDESLFADDLNRLAAVGVIKGCDPPSNDRVCPTLFLSRAELVVLLHRIELLGLVS